MKILQLIAMLLCVFLSSADGATVLLEDGTVLKGEIAAETETEVVIKTAMGELRVAKSLIKMIERPSRNVTGLARGWHGAQGRDRGRNRNRGRDSKHLSANCGCRDRSSK